MYWKAGVFVEEKSFRYLLSMKSPTVIFIMRGATQMDHFCLLLSIHVFARNVFDDGALLGL